MVELWRPRQPDDLWMARQEELNLARPVFTGDVFEIGDIPGVTAEESAGSNLAMLVQHPCAMRAGPRLRERVEVARVLIGEPIEMSAWSQHKTKMPLPGLFLSGEPELEGGAAGQHFVALDLVGRVDASEVNIYKRIASLLDAGIGALLQRRTWRQTQYVAAHEEFMRSNEHVVAEAALHEQWCEELMPDLPDAEPEEAVSRLEAEAVAFDNVLSAKRETPGVKKSATFTYRADLADLGRRSAAYSAVRREIREEKRRRAANTAVVNPD